MGGRSGERSILIVTLDGADAEVPSPHAEAEDFTVSTTEKHVPGSGLGSAFGKVLMALTFVLGAGAAALIMTGEPVDARTLEAVLTPVASLVSITVPFLGVLAVTDLHHRSERVGTSVLLRRLALTQATAVGFGAFGVLVSVALLAVLPAATDRWDHLGMLALAGILVQMIAQLTGSGFGMLLRSRIVAMACTVVFPLGLWAVLGAIAFVEPLQAWLAPYSSVQQLLSGEMTPQAWLRVGVVVLVWGVGLNVAGALRIRRSAQAAS